MRTAAGRFIRVLIADDHPIFREGLKRVLNELPFTVVGEAETCAETMTRLAELEVDVLLLDLRMPRRGGLSLLEDILRDHPGVATLVVSVEPEEMFALRAIQAGASGFLQKEEADSETLRAAVESLAAGRRYITPSIAARLAEFVSAPNAGKAPSERLSDRELQVLSMMGTGKSVSEVADDLTLSVKTVSTYRSRILDKTGMKNTAQLIRYALDKHLA